MRGKRINEFDVIVTASAGEAHQLPGLVTALRTAGLKAWKLDKRTIQVSFDEYPELREELPGIGAEYEIQTRRDEF